MRLLRRYGGHFCLSALLLAAAVSTQAADWKSLKPQGYVSDFANVIDAESKQAIESYAGQLEQATGVQLAFVTVASLEGEPIEDVTNDVFRSFGVGKKKEDNGAMVLLSIQDRKSRLEVGGGLGEFVPDGMAGLLLDDMRPALRQGQYGAAMLAAAQRLGQTIADAKHVTIAAPQAPVRVPRGTRDSIPWPFILFGIFILLMLLRGGRGGRGPSYRGGGGGGFWTGLLLGQLLNSGNRGWGGGRDGGGFGGFDSGGSGGGFGGFGGGDSGGGGASSDW